MFGDVSDGLQSNGEIRICTSVAGRQPKRQGTRNRPARDVNPQARAPWHVFVAQTRAPFGACIAIVTNVRLGRDQWDRWPSLVCYALLDDIYKTGDYGMCVYSI